MSILQRLFGTTDDGEYEKVEVEKSKMITKTYTTYDYSITLTNKEKFVTDVRMERREEGVVVQTVDPSISYNYYMDRPTLYMNESFDRFFAYPNIIEVNEKGSTTHEIEQEVTWTETKKQPSPNSD